jgi:hypothetical protein
MKWREVRGVVTGKLKGRIEAGAGHEMGFVSCGKTFVGKVLLGRHSEMKPWEIQGCAASLGLNKSRFVDLVSCTLSREHFCEYAGAPLTPDKSS